MSYLVHVCPYLLQVCRGGRNASFAGECAERGPTKTTADAVVMDSQVSTYQVATVRVVDAPLAGEDQERDERITKRRVRRLHSKVCDFMNASCTAQHPTESCQPGFV